MSNIVLQPNASGTGSITIATPNTNTDRILNIPDVAGNLVTTGDTGTVTAGMVSAVNQSSLPAGSLLQTIQTGTIARFTTTTSGTWQDSNTTLSITPSSTSSKILVNVICPVVVAGTSQNLRGGIRILRGSTVIWNTYGFAELFQVRNADNEFNVVNPAIILDSPSSTSSVTYKVQAYLRTGTTLILWESTMGQNMTLQEIKG
jgi:hypothetical protein